MCRPLVKVVDIADEDAIRNSLCGTHPTDKSVEPRNVAIGRVKGGVIVFTNDEEVTQHLTKRSGWRAFYDGDIGEKRVVKFIPYPHHLSIDDVLAVFREITGVPPPEM